MQRPAVVGLPVLSPVLLVGQAPGAHEAALGRPFAWTAGKTLFGWFAGIGLEEASFRRRVHMAAVCRCFPGKNPAAGDRVPDAEETARCGIWLQAEFALLRPRLILPVGKLAIRQLMPLEKLNDVVGERWPLRIQDFRTDVIPLPHPSGASTWHRMEPGRTRLARALALIAEHPAWRDVCLAEPPLAAPAGPEVERSAPPGNRE